MHSRFWTQIFFRPRYARFTARISGCRIPRVLKFADLMLRPQYYNIDKVRERTPVIPDVGTATPGENRKKIVQKLSQVWRPLGQNFSGVLATAGIRFRATHCLVREENYA